MTRRMKTCLAASVILFGLSVRADAQNPDARRAVTQPTVQELQKLINDKVALARLLDDQVLDNFNALVLAASTETASGRFIVEANRLDKQVGASSRAAGTTNLVASGSVPRLLGFALETGAITQTQSGTSVTLQTNPAGLAQALAKASNAAGASFDDAASQHTLNVLRRFNVSATFDAGQNTAQGFTGSYRQLQQFAAQIYLYNHRDPTHPAWRSVWNGFPVQVGNSLANTTSALALTLAKEPAFVALRTAARTRILSAATGADIEQAYLEYVEGFKPFVPESIAARMLNEWVGYLRAQNETYRAIARSQILTLEYALDRPPVQDAPAEAFAPESAVGAPDLSTLRLIWVRPFLGASDMTVDASASFFNQEVAGMSGQMRDWQVGGKLDFPVGRIATFSKAQFTLAAMYMRLLESPLGVPVTVNGVAVDRTGPLGFLQARLRVPLGDGPFSVPLSLTYASRTELIADESQVRGNVGLTVDFDKFLR